MHTGIVTQVENLTLSHYWTPINKSSDKTSLCGEIILFVQSQAHLQTLHLKAIPEIRSNGFTID